MLAAQENTLATVAMEHEEYNRSSLSLLSSEQLIKVVLQQDARMKELEKTVEFLKEEASAVRKENVSLVIVI
jgi:hypothetical protein